MGVSVDAMWRLLLMSVIALGLHGGVGAGAHAISKNLEDPIWLRSRLVDKQLLEEIRKRIAELDDDDPTIAVDLEKLDAKIAEMPETASSKTDTPLFLNDLAWLPEPPPPPEDPLSVALADAPEEEIVEPPPAAVGVDVLTAKSDARAAEIASALAELDVRTVSVLGGGVATEGVLGSSDVPTGLLDDAGRSAMGSRTGAPDGVRGARGSAGLSGNKGAAGGDGKRSLKDIGSVEGGTMASVRKRPRGRVATGSPSSSDVANAPSVLRRMSGRFRACYNAALKVNPELAGTVKLRFRVGPNGDVLSDKRKDMVLKDVPGVTDCILGVLKAGGFSPPKSGEIATIRFQISFVQKK